MFFPDQSGFFQGPEQMSLHFLLLCAEDGPAWDDQDAAWQDGFLAQPERFSDQTPCSVPDDSRVMQFAAADDAIPGDLNRIVRLCRLHQNREERIPAGFSVFLERIEILSGTQFSLFPQADAPGFHGAILSQITVRRLRPFALLLARTWRPPLVAILARNPYLRARLTTEG